MPYSVSMAVKHAPVSEDRSAADALGGFLASVEAMAFRIAVMSTRNDEDALDVVQDAMMKLAPYATKAPADEWRLIFFKILSNCLTDWHRRQQTRNKVFAWWAKRPNNDESGKGSADVACTPDLEDAVSEQPMQQMMRQEFSATLEAALLNLSFQQRQVFLFRHWEGLSVQETAAAMNISEGSVKTHLSRARKNLAETLAPLYSGNSLDTDVRS